MILGRRGAVLAGLAGAWAGPGRARAQPARRLRLGVLSAFTGEYSDGAGAGSVLAARMAAEDFLRAQQPGFTVEVLAADMQDKPDIGAGLARAWFDRDGVDAVLDVPNSAVALAVAAVAEERNKVALLSGAGAAALSTSRCGPNHLQWTYDTYALASGTAQAMLAQGGRSWFFITADYAFGHALQADTARVVQAGGGTVLGASVFAFPNTTDFSSHLLQAQASGADVIGLACTANHFSNVVKQAAEFRIGRQPQAGKVQRLASLICLLTNVHAIGLPDAQGLVLTEPFYWDLNDATREFTARFAPRNGGIHPTMVHAGAYSAATHYLKAVASLGLGPAQADGAATVAAMKAIPAIDGLLGRGVVRDSGSVAHDMHLFQVKAPADSRAPWDYYRHLRTIPAEDAFLPPSPATCRLVRA